MSNQDAAFGLRPAQNEHKLAESKTAIVLPATVQHVFSKVT